MDSFQCKTLLTKRSFHYTYYVSPSKDHTRKDGIALLFLHGFPDSAHLWIDVIANLGSLSCKMIVPDCLGYAGTDKPEDPAAYAYKDQADDFVEILHEENVTSAVVIGHDWGSALAQRTYLHHRELISGVVLLNTAYMVPSEEPFDLVKANRSSEEVYGYPRFAYWEFFLAADAPELIDNNLEKMWQILHGDLKDWMRKMFGVRNAMRDFLTAGENVPLKAYASQSKWREQFLKQMKDGFASTFQMYKAEASGVLFRSDSTIAKQSLAIEVPTLFVTCTGDAVCPAEWMIPAKEQGLVPDLKEVTVECAHWSPMEKPGEIAIHIRDFLQSRFPTV